MRYPFIFLFLVLSCYSQAQSYKKVLRTAEDLYASGQYISAIPYLKTAYQGSNQDSLLALKLGMSYLKSQNRTESNAYLKVAYKKNPLLSEDLLFFLAFSYQLVEKPDSALIFYDLYEQKNPKSPLVEHLSDRRKESHSAMFFLAHPTTAKIENIGQGINTVFSEYAPVLDASGTLMAFTARKADGTGGTNAGDGEAYEDIYFSQLVNHNWSKPINVGSPVNSNYHDAAVALSADGNTLLMYKDINGGDIYLSWWQDFNWSEPVSMGSAINSRYYEAHAVMSPDGKRVFFSSDRPGGYGGLDIYEVHRDAKGRWDKPFNLGPAINTETDEDAPFWDAKKDRMYFSSRGHGSMGGYDIFYSQHDSLSWMSPINMGSPINSPDDDLYYSVVRDSIAYYSSGRFGGLGGKDIFSIAPPKDSELLLLNKKRPNLESLISGWVVNKASKEGVAAEMLMISSSGDSIKVMSNAETGYFVASIPISKSVELLVESKKYEQWSPTKYPLASWPYTTQLVIELIPLGIGEKIELENIFFDNDQFTLRKESFLELNKVVALLKKYNTLNIKIIGHTDNVGTAEYNQELSLQRAQTVVKYLTEAGISEKRLSYIGLGFEQPVSNNETEEGRKLNRRTEFEIMGNKIN